MELRHMGVRLFFICMLVLVVACSSETTPETETSVISTPSIEETSPLPSPIVLVTLPALVVESGKGGVQGYVEVQKSDWEGESLQVYFCPFTPDQSGVTGVYILEPSIHPRTKLQDGQFQMGDVPPGKYVVVVGPQPEVSIPIRENGEIKVFEIVEDQILDIDAEIY